MSIWLLVPLETDEASVHHTLVVPLEMLSQLPFTKGYHKCCTTPCVTGKVHDSSGCFSSCFAKKSGVHHSFQSHTFPFSFVFCSPAAFMLCNSGSRASCAAEQLHASQLRLDWRLSNSSSLRRLRWASSASARQRISGG